MLSGVDLEIADSGIFAVLGPNGSGKTTLIKCILGMVVPDRGRISVTGKSIEKAWKYRSEIDYLPQIANFPGNLKVRELIRMIKDLRQMPGNENHLISLFELEPFLDKKLVTLSGGTKQKVNIVLAFMFDTPAATIQLKHLIAKERQKGKTFLITSHIMQFVEETADEIVYLLEGKIYFKGSISDLKAKTERADFEHAIAAIANAKIHV